MPTRAWKPGSTKANADCAVDKRCRAIPYSPAAARHDRQAMRPKLVNLPHDFYQKPSRVTLPINFVTPFNETWGAATGDRHAMRNIHADKNLRSPSRYGTLRRKRTRDTAMFGRSNEGGHLPTSKKRKPQGTINCTGATDQQLFLRYQLNSGRPVNLTVLP